MSSKRKDKITIRLSQAQIGQVIRDVVGEDGVAKAAGEIQDYRRLKVQYEVVQGAGDTSVSTSLLKGLAVLACFPPAGEALKIVDVCSSLELTQATAHRYIRTLVLAGLLIQDPESREYRRASGTR